MKTWLYILTNDWDRCLAETDAGPDVVLPLVLLLRKYKVEAHAELVGGMKWGEKYRERGEQFSLGATLDPLLFDGRQGWLRKMLSVEAARVLVRDWTAIRKSFRVKRYYPRLPKWVRSRAEEVKP